MKARDLVAGFKRLFIEERRQLVIGLGEAGRLIELRFEAQRLTAQLAEPVNAELRTAI